MNNIFIDKVFWEIFWKVLEKFFCKNVCNIYLTISKFPTQNTLKATDYQYNKLYQSLKLWQSVVM